jgi:hypothetical protein
MLCSPFELCLNCHRSHNTAESRKPCCGREWRRLGWSCDLNVGCGSADFGAAFGAKLIFDEISSCLFTLCRLTHFSPHNALRLVAILGQKTCPAEVRRKEGEKRGNQFIYQSSCCSFPNVTYLPLSHDLPFLFTSMSRALSCSLT